MCKVILQRMPRLVWRLKGESNMPDYCKVIEKCKTPCGCLSDNESGLSQQISVPRPTERVIEREIVELATRCEECGSVKETP